MGITKVLVAYMSLTGNTKKVAEAIYGEIAAEKEIKPIEEVQDVGAYDLSFLGFPTHQGGPDKKTKEFLGRHCTNGRKVALFVTHSAPMNAPELLEWMPKFKEAAAGANLVGFFDCQGQPSKMVKFVMRMSSDENTRASAKRDDSKGQPNEATLDRARAFARETLSRLA
ncbi:MAG: flavodoxin family protein [Methanomassiliicoccales archaeon]|nr:flavodoxin family protein [Methanomassiliicoccales archaeon]